MKCYETKRQLNLFLDNELDVEQNMKVLEHLNICSACSSIFEGEKRLATVVKDSIPRETASPELIKRIRERLIRIDTPKWYSNLLTEKAIASMAAGMLIVVTALFILVIFGHRKTQLTGVEIAKAAVDHQMKMNDSIVKDVVDVSTSENPTTELYNYYRNTVPFDVCVHTVGNYKTYKGTVCKLLNGKEFCWTVEIDRENNKTISHVSFTYDNSIELASEETIDIGNRRFYYYEYMGYSVIITRCPYGACLYVLKSKDDAVNIANLLVKAH